MNSLLNWHQDSLEEGGRQELEIFITGGVYEFKKALIDIGKIINTEDGVIMARINTQIDDQATYKVYIPKKLI